ncbi:uncharacterized protein C2845_PM11G19050 [Panicum miliaceum]|uniref:Uncharacterized protein n=1 Tax=Panicum miliaceum TaxID=4540 RepID=A0A3L6RPW0_PANMI|nr:uncharacterized protein C2845_PM11G19050 [Panicum miliaceum]
MTSADVAAAVTNVKLPTTGSMLVLNVDTSANHAASAFQLVEAASEDLNSEKLYVEAFVSEAQADATANVTARHDIILAVQNVADELQEGTTSMAMKDVVSVLNLTTTTSSASDILPSNWNINMSAPGNISTSAQVSPRTTLVIDIAMLSSKLMLQNMLGFTIPASR